MQVCPLCQKTQTVLFYEEKRRPFYKCEHCCLVFVPKDFHISFDEEKKRYDQHQNNEKSEQFDGYKKWMQDFWAWIKETPLRGKICDYGSGPHPILSEFAKVDGLELISYDLHYANQTKADLFDLDLLILSEVVEHFRAPYEEWNELREMVKKSGRICIRTSLWNEGTRWKDWAYARDNTHINFYHQKTMSYLAQSKGLELIRLEKDKIEFRKL